MRREETEKFEQNSICKACEEIVQYYCCYHWCGLISRPFHYLTTTTKTDLQIAILEKPTNFLCF